MLNMKGVKLCFFLIFLLKCCQAFNILVVFTHAGQSHFRVFDKAASLAHTKIKFKAEAIVTNTDDNVKYMSNQGQHKNRGHDPEKISCSPGAEFYIGSYGRFFQELGKRGHNLTILTYVKPASKVENSREILLMNEGLQEVIDLGEVTGSRSELYGGAHLIASFADGYLNSALGGKNFQNFLKENNTYDVIIAEYFNSNAYFGLFTKFKAPVIGLSSTGTLPWHPQWFGSPDNPSYIPLLFMDYSPYMTFLKRVESTILLLMNKWWYISMMEWPGTKLSRQYIGEEPMDPYNTDLLFINTYHTLHGARPLTPSIIEIGGISVGKPKKLPSDIETWINEAKHGVIYFSLGSMIKSVTMSEEKRVAFIKAFARLPQRVLWKWENETLINKPNNVIIKSWMPQLDILCHANVKAFITHGGLGGTTESVHCGVPMIVLPQFGDQHYNAKAAETSGAGIILKLNDATEETIYESLQKVLTPEFQLQAKTLSQRFRDRPMPPLETAIYWVEHLARHKNGRHMRSAAIDMPFYKYFLLDVIGFLLALLALISYLLRRIVRLVINFKKSFKQKMS